MTTSRHWRQARYEQSIRSFRLAGDGQEALVADTCLSLAQAVNFGIGFRMRILSISKVTGDNSCLNRSP
jgi:hypothetical protein